MDFGAALTGPVFTQTIRGKTSPPSPQRQHHAEREACKEAALDPRLRDGDKEGRRGPGKAGAGPASFTPGH